MEGGDEVNKMASLDIGGSKVSKEERERKEEEAIEERAEGTEDVADSILLPVLGDTGHKIR